MSALLTANSAWICLVIRRKKRYKEMRMDGMKRGCRERGREEERGHKDRKKKG